MAALQLKSSHTEQHTVVETVDSLGLEVLPHPPYSSDLAPSDYHLSGPMKKMLSGQKFASDMQVQWAVHQWLAQQPTLFFALGIHKVVERWDKCSNKLVEDMSKKESMMPKELTFVVLKTQIYSYLSNLFIFTGKS